MSRVALAAGVVALALALALVRSVEAAPPQNRTEPADLDAAARLASAARVVKQVRIGITQEQWARARCVIVIPEAGNLPARGLRRGVMSCRSGDAWSAPLFVGLAKGSWPARGDLLILMTHESAVAEILASNVQLARNEAEIVSYVSANGRLAGGDLSGSELAPDENANIAVYGRGAVPSTILASRQLSAPTEASPFLVALGAASADLARTALSAPASQPTPRGSGAEAHAADRSMSDVELRAQLMNAEQTIDRMLGESAPVATGTSGVRQEDNDPRRAGTVVVERARLLQLRQQLEAILARLNQHS